MSALSFYIDWLRLSFWFWLTMIEKDRRSEEWLCRANDCTFGERAKMKLSYLCLLCYSTRRTTYLEAIRTAPRWQGRIPIKSKGTRDESQGKKRKNASILTSTKCLRISDICSPSKTSSSIGWARWRIPIYVETSTATDAYRDVIVT